MSFPTRFALAALLAATAVPFGAARPAGDGTAAIPEPGPMAYRAYFLERLDAMHARYFRDEHAFLDPSGSHLHVAALAAAAEMRAWEWSGDARYADAAVARLRRIAALGDGVREVGFFTPFPLAFAYRAAQKAKRVDEPLRAAMEPFVARTFRPRDFESLNNQTMIRACGLELAAQVWPHLPQAKEWHDYALRIDSLVERVEDIPENAPNYNTFDLVCTWLLSDLLKRPELPAKPGIRAMFGRYRDQVSPLGWIPPYGDSGSASRPPDPDWPMNSPWAHYVAAFERAAREYRDPTLRWAAARLAQTGMRHMPLGEAYGDIESLLYFSFAPEWADESLAPRQPEVASQVLTRRDEREAAALDKLILAPSRRPGAPFLLADLYCRGAHAHVNQHGCVSYFEFGDVPLLTALGYNNREPSHANLVLMRPRSEPFPYTPGGFVPGVWHEASLPTARLPLCDPARPYLRRIDKVNFRVTAGRRGVTFTAADLCLAGAGRPPIEVDPLRLVEGWGGSPAAGEEGLVWQVAPGTHFLEKDGFGREFDCREYPVLGVRWKLSNADEWARPLIVRVHSAAASLDYHAQADQLEPVLLEAKIEELGGIEYGTLRYSGWFTPGTTLTREMAVTPGGALVVRDTLTPGAGARDMAAGPIWHLASTTEPAAGPDWFNSAGGRMELLAWLAPAPGRVLGRQAVDIWSKEHQQTVFARQPIEPGRPVTFLSVLIPHPRGTDAASLAAGIGVLDDRRVTLRHEGVTVEFTSRAGH